MGTVLITGANRGIGLGCVTHYLAKGWQVHVVSRRLSDELSALAAQHDTQMIVHLADVTDEKALRSIAAGLGDVKFDVLINNAGVYGGAHQQFGDIDYADWLRVFEVNTLAPMRIAEIFHPHIAPGGKLAMMSSRMGSIDDASTGSYIYRTSKTALNMVSKLLAADLASKNISVVTLHPGSVQTDMGGKDALITVEESVAGLTQVIADLTAAESGAFKNYKGETLKW